MPKELNLSAYDYRNNRRPSATSSRASDYDSEDSELRRSTNTETTYGNDTVMTGDHVEAILRFQSKTEKLLRRQQQQQQQQPLLQMVAGADNEEEDEDSSSDSGGVVPNVKRRSKSRSNSLSSTELIQVATSAAAAAADESGGLGDPSSSSSLSNNIINSSKNSSREVAQQYGTAMGGNEANHPISNLLKDIQVNNRIFEENIAAVSNTNTSDDDGAIRNNNNAVSLLRQLASHNNSSSSNGDDIMNGGGNELFEGGSDSCDNKSSSNGSGSNVYHIPDTASALSSLASLATSARSGGGGGGDRKSFISAILKYGAGGDDNNDEEDEQERLVKNYSDRMVQQEQQQQQQQPPLKENNEAGTGEEQFENDEESQIQQQQDHNIHQRLIDMPHYHNLRGSFKGLSSHIKDKAGGTSSTPTAPPPPVKYSDRVEQQQQHNHDDEKGKGGHQAVVDEEEQHYDLRLHTGNDGSSSASLYTSPNNNKQQRRPSRRPIYRQASMDSIWSRRLTTESESMWTMFTSTLTTRRNSNGSVVEGGMAPSGRRRNSNWSETSTEQLAGKQQQKQHYHHRHQAFSQNEYDCDDEEEQDGEEDDYEKEPYDDSDIRSVKSRESMDSWIGMGNLENIIGSNIVGNNGKKMRKRVGGDGKGDYHYGHGNFGVDDGGGGRKRRGYFNPFARFNPVATRRGSMTPFVTEDGGDYFYDDVDTSRYYFYRPGMKTLRRCGAICILIALTALSSVLIGIYIPPSVGEVLEAEEEELFKIAESINQHCETSKLHSAKGRRRCEKLCKNHLCCFDMMGDGYSCRKDKSKNCGVYSGCEALVDSFEGKEQEQQSEIKDQIQKGEASDDAVSLDGGFGDEIEDYNDDFGMYYEDDENGDNDDPFGSDAIFWNPGGQLTTSISTTTQAGEVGSPSTVDNVCTESVIKTLDGRRQCETLCKDHHCCFDPIKWKSCRTDPDKMCSTYASCEVLTLDIGTDTLDANSDGTTTHEEIKIGSQVIGAACEESNVHTPTGKQECEAVCSSHHCCFTKSDFNCRSEPDKNCPSYAACEILNVIAYEEGKMNGVVYHDNHQMDDNDADPHNTVAAIQFSEEHQMQIKQDISKSCKAKTSPDCFHACRDWFCCFESSDEKSCRSRTNNLCNLVQQCEVAAVSSGTLVDDEQDDSQAQSSSSQQQVQQQQQQQDDYYQGDFPGLGPSSQQMQQQDDYYEDDFLGLGPSSQQIQQQEDFDLQESSLRPQQQPPQLQDDTQSSVPVPPMQQQPADFRPQPTQQVQQQQNNVQQEDEFVQPQQQSQQQAVSQPQPAQQVQQQQNEIVQPQQQNQQQADFRPQPAQQVQQQQNDLVQSQQQNQQQVVSQPQPAQQVQQQQNELVQPQQQNNFQPLQQQNSQNQQNIQQPMPPQQNNVQSQNDVQPPMQQQPQKPQNMQTLPPQQQQNVQIQSQPQYTQQVDYSQPQQQPQQQQQQQQQQQPITPPQQPMAQNNFQSSVENLPQQQQSGTNVVASTPPRPPPARCIPTGDDEIHTEVYNDDWNDDSYDRCKRWESKYGMKISQYIDLYGVGS